MGGGELASSEPMSDWLDGSDNLYYAAKCFHAAGRHVLMGKVDSEAACLSARHGSWTPCTGKKCPYRP